MPEPDAGLLGERDQLADRVGDHAGGPAAGPCCRGPARRRPGSARRPRARRPPRTAARLSASAAALRLGVRVGEEAAPAQAGDVQRRRPATAAASRPGRPRRPGRATGPMAGMSCRTHRLIASAADRFCTVAWLSESRPGRSRCRRCAARYSVIRRRPAPGLAAHRRAAASSKTRIRCACERRCCSRQHGEVRLEAVEPGQERHADLVVVGRRGEDQPAERHGRAHRRVVAGQVALVQRVQGGGGWGGDRRERAEQRVAVAVASPLISSA